MEMYSISMYYLKDLNESIRSRTQQYEQRNYILFKNLLLLNDESNYFF